MGSQTDRLKLWQFDGGDFVSPDLVEENIRILDQLPHPVGPDSALPDTPRFLGDTYYASDKGRLYFGSSLSTWEILTGNPTARMYSNTTQTIPNGAVTLVDFQVVDWDTDGMADVASNLITIPHSGLWHIEGMWSETTAFVDATFQSTLFRLSGAERGEKEHRIFSKASLGAGKWNCLTVNLTAGTTVGLLAYHVEGGNHDIHNLAHGANYLTATYLSGRILNA